MTQPTEQREFVIEGVRLRCLIVNAHSLLRNKFRKSPLWAMVSSLTGHGSTASCEMCRSVGLDPHQLSGAEQLQPFQQEQKG